MNSPLGWQQRARALQTHYQRFAVAERVLLTGHSHQAWPDVALAGQMRAFEDAARHVDDKWGYAFAQAERLRTTYARMLGDTDGDYALGASTQELLVRWLSALPLQHKPRLVTTDGEFHSMRRLLDRLGETGIELVKLPADPVASLAQRLSDALDQRTAAVLVSAVLFQSGRIVPQLAELARAARAREVPLLVDAYHAVNVLPLSLAALDLQDAFIVGGGYKYCQFGEGNCFLRVPSDCDWRPLVTGWYAEFAQLERGPNPEVQYGRGRWAFEGSTYDPVSHYRAAAVIDFFDEQGLSTDVLHAQYRAQQRYLLERLRVHRWPAHLQLPDEELEAIGGFLVLRTPHASQIVQDLRRQQVYVDCREDALRLGPAPYVAAEQLDAAAEALHQLVSAY